MKYLASSRGFHVMWSCYVAAARVATCVSTLSNSESKYQHCLEGSGSTAVVAGTTAAVWSIWAVGSFSNGSDRMQLI